MQADSSSAESHHQRMADELDWLEREWLDAEL
jgi:hypothetical protein